MPSPIRNGPITRPTVATNVTTTVPTTVTTPGPVTPTPWRPPVVGPARPTQGPLFNTPAYNIEIPEGLGRPPRATDVKVVTGFDGLSPAAVVDKTLQNLAGKVAPQNLAFVQRSITERHRDFTVACSNVFVANSPPRKFLESLNPQSIRVLGTMSSMQPVVYEVVRRAGGKPEYYARNSSGGFDILDKPRGTPVMAADLRLNPAGIAVSYLPWTNKALAGPLSSIVES
jgi:hypothetical protein